MRETEVKHLVKVNEEITFLDANPKAASQHTLALVCMQIEI